MAIRTRSVIFIFFALSAFLAAYQMRSSIRLMFDHSEAASGENEEIIEAENKAVNSEDTAVQEMEKFQQSSKQKLPFGEKFPPVRREDFLKTTVSTKSGKRRITIKADALKKTVSSSLISGLKHHADSENKVVVSVVDYGYLDFALNFKEISIDRMNITNYLLVCTDKRSHAELNLIGIPCCYFDYNNAESDKPSNFGTAEYYEKTNAKTAVMIQALHLGYSVLMIDVDVILFRNPFPYFPCPDCDVHVQMDRDMYNSGFVYVRPTLAAKTLYDRAWNLYVKYQRAHDQAYFNMAIKALEQENRSPRIYTLSTKLFPCGVYYFEHGNRMFENVPKCDECIMAHNNYLGSYAAKVYRLKENLLWAVDRNGYYSNASGRYLTYENPSDFGARTMQMELDALRNALAVAAVTNRTLILPAFRCCSCNSRVECSHPMHKCSLLSVLVLRYFDAAFLDSYREHSFLNHPKVSTTVKSSLSSCIFINSSDSAVVNISRNCRVFQPANSETGATVEELEEWFTPFQNISVLQFHSMYGETLTKQIKNSKRFKKSHIFAENPFTCSEYEQWDKSVLHF